MNVLINSSLKNRGISDNKIKKIVSAVFKDFNNHKDSYLSINLVGDKKIRIINNFYRCHDSITDIISFALHDTKPLSSEKDDLGDIFICLPQIKRQSKENDVSFEEEFTRILVHGILHILGFDHVKKKDAEKMFSLQEKIVNKKI